MFANKLAADPAAWLLQQRFSLLEIAVRDVFCQNVFLSYISCQKNVTARDCENRDRLDELYLRHVIPLPQRSLPNSRWGRRMERSRGRDTMAGHR